MSIGKIYYKCGYKYQLNEAYSVVIPDIPEDLVIEHEYGNLKNKLLTINKGYAWDGPSGPTVDTKDFMRGSLVHDFFYQMIREEQLPSKFRGFADYLLREHCIEDGMAIFRADYVYAAVCAFGNMAASEKQIILEAP